MARAFLEVSCDESGNEGENLSRAGSRIFAHAGISIGQSDAAAIMAEVRRQLGTKVGELKSSMLLDAVNRDVLERLLDEPRLTGMVNIHLTDKRYFVNGKIVDMIVETVLHDRGHNLYRHGRAREMAHVLFVDGPLQLGPDWDKAVDEFNTMLRVAVRTGTKATLDDFYQTLDTLRPHAAGKLATILRLVHAGRDEAAELIANMKTTSLDYLALDPTFAALATVVRTWHDRAGMPIRVIHDETSLLTPRRIKTMQNGLADPAVLEVDLTPVTLHSVELVDSKIDPRIQVADLLAGAARVIAADALADAADVALVEKLRPFVDPNSVWADDSSWDLLIGAT